MAKMTVPHRLHEIQWRLIIIAVFFIAGATLAYYFQEPVINMLLALLKDEKSANLNPAGGFSFIFLVSIYAGIALALPIIIQQIYSFLKPALPIDAQGKSAKIIISSFLLLIAGMAFGYFVAVPNALNFLYSSASQYTEAPLTANSYLNFVIAYTIGIGIAFQAPLVLMLIHTIKPMKPSWLLKSEVWIILFSFIAAAIIAPTPDLIKKAIIAGPVIITYQFGVAVLLFSIFKNHRKTVRAKKQASALLRASAQMQMEYDVKEEPIPDTVFAALLDAPQTAEDIVESTPFVPSQPLTFTQQRARKFQSMDGMARKQEQTPLMTPAQRAASEYAQNQTRQRIPGARRFSVDGFSSL